MRKFRTAVLVVHGIGSQRPLETVRGIINAVWFDDDDHKKANKKLWSHPEPSGVDLDLTVMTTNAIKGTTDKRCADFHELYWAHHMSETKSVAVLLWLFELGRKGPRFKPGMNALWWGGAIFLALLHLSASLIALKGIEALAKVGGSPEWMVITPALMLLVAFAVAAAVAGLGLAMRAAVWAVVFAAFIFLLLYSPHAVSTWLGWTDGQAKLTMMTNVCLPLLLAAVALVAVMKWWGLAALVLAYVFSWMFFGVYLLLAKVGYFPDDGLAALAYSGRFPWSLTSPASIVAAGVVIGVYLVINAWFLTPFLGDAARYFRNSPANVAVRRTIRKDAVDTLDSLHASGFYDRIIVVAHSLGCVVAYDMLRAYYSRICDSIPVTKALEPEFSRIDQGTLGIGQLRGDARVLVRKMAASHAAPKTVERGRASSHQGPHVWLVTDFVTLGNALTHAHYLMCDGYAEKQLDDDFDRRVDEREFPTCPPNKNGPDGWLAFKNPYTKKPQLHHGGLFALTRWSNIYFPLQQVFWGDAIGGPVGSKGSVFGSHIHDEEVWTDSSKPNGVFTHTQYWNTEYKEGRAAPHIVALRKAINLEDKP